jgi:hypothetical protein
MAKSKSTSSSKGNRKNSSINPEVIEPVNQAATADPSETKAGVAGATSAETAAAETTKFETKIAHETKVAPETRKLEVVKSEPRKNVVPINLEDEIRRRAYEIYQQRGNSPGSESDDWLVAEREVRQRYHHQQQHTA